MAEPTCGARVRSGTKEGDVLIDNEDGTFCVEWDDGDEEDAVPRAKLVVIDADGKEVAAPPPEWADPCPEGWEVRVVDVALKTRRQEVFGVDIDADGVVSSVKLGGGAMRVGITVGMRIASVNGQKVAPSDLAATLAAAGQQFAVGVLVPPADPTFAAARRDVEDRAATARTRAIQPDIFAAAASDPRIPQDPEAQFRAAQALCVHFLMITDELEKEERAKLVRQEDAAWGALLQRKP
eukprot:TRINITY_DN43757_c0_g1_i1.p2 TRINITY_DN43757_c0_g1~~TRINITY_DN43757_c0_g1_i1.p2  ORF type:complete len:238 (+),score=75.06 TRINITY_DN43757_c0_g1_i1:65-778(+)